MSEAMQPLMAQLNGPQVAADPVTPPAAHAFGRDLDRLIAATQAKFTGGLSPASYGLAFADWMIHLAAAPGRRTDLLFEALYTSARLLSRAAANGIGPQPESFVEPKGDDSRFRDASWNDYPYCLFRDSFLAAEDWWCSTAKDLPGASPQHMRIAAFTIRQLMDMVSPTNFVASNPIVARRTIEAGGFNLVAGWQNWWEDTARLLTRQRPLGAENFRPGDNVAATPGKVVYQNHLIELLQFSPTTDMVHAEPVLIVPAWIMKYYILDLSPENSLIKYLVSQGHTVFCLSWRNVGAEDRDISLDQYRRLGVMAAIDAVDDFLPQRKIHAAGYCLGGTLLAIAAAAMAEADDQRLASLTLFTTQVDFSEPGELQLFINDSQVAMLEDLMWFQGTLGASQMAGAFQFIRSNDLVWSRMIHDYLLGERSPMNDLMAWNADTTRMPYRMHSEYLRRLFLQNDLASGRLIVDGRPIALQNIRLPIFAVGTERDHIAPWQSVYKIHYLTDTDLTFALASGGHNAGVVSEPGHPHRSYRIAHREPGEICVSAEEWQHQAEKCEGSWWHAWSDWLAAHSGPKNVPAPLPENARPGQAPLIDAPGTYVMQS